MKLMSENDYKLFEKIVGSSQETLRKAMGTYLKSKYSKVNITKDYITAEGDLPIALVAHMDTVHRIPVENLYYDRMKGVMWSSEGLGADDRAGIFAIIKIIQSGLRPSIILTTDEELAGAGASVLASQECPFKNLKYLIELDRRGTNDCVFYDCYNPEFVKYIESFGFVERFGTFSDISFLCPIWNICGVNLSIGYENEHSLAEILNIAPLFDTIRKVKIMLLEKDIPDFEYKEIFENKKIKLKTYLNLEEKLISCSKCNKSFYEYELIPVKTENETEKHYCIDCMVDHLDWCEICKEPFEKNKNNKIKNICPKCQKKEVCNN